MALGWHIIPVNNFRAPLKSPGSLHWKPLNNSRTYTMDRVLADQIDNGEFSNYEEETNII